MGILAAFGVSWKSLLAQFVNFAILMFLLHRFAYKPMLQFMKDRSEKIAKGLADAKAAEQALADGRKAQEQALVAARKEAGEIIEAARVSADAQAASIIAKAKEEVGSVVAQGKAVLQMERERMLQDVKKDVVSMVIASAEKILAGAVDENVDQKWVKKQFEQVKR